MEKDKRFYWLKLKRDFFKRHDIQIIESMPNGKDYILFYLKLLCESVDHDGNLRFSDEIPYNEEMLSVITHTNIDIVRSAITVFSKLNMMEILDDGTFYMNEVNKMIGSAVDNDNANRQRRFREKQKQLALQESYDSVTNNNESKSIDIDKDIDIKKENIKEKKDEEMEIINKIFDFWNSLNIIKHSKLNETRIKAIKNRLKEYPYEIVMIAMRHYEIVLHDNNSFWSYTWSLEDFLNRKNGFTTFLDDGSNWVSYESKSKNPYSSGDIPRETAYPNLKKNYL